MLSIILIVLKVIGIVLLILLGLFFLAVSAVLFVPIRYRGQGSFYGRPKGNGKITWLLHIVSVRAEYDETLKLSVRLFGFPLLKESGEEAKETVESGAEKVVKGAEKAAEFGAYEAGEYEAAQYGDTEEEAPGSPGLADASCEMPDEPMLSIQEVSKPEDGEMEAGFKLKEHPEAEAAGSGKEKAETGKAELSEEESGKTESVKEEPGSVESAEEESGMTESAEKEFVKTESVKKGSGKTKSVKEEPGSAESAEEESGKTESVKKGSGKMESAEEEFENAESVKEEPGSVESTEEESKKKKSTKKFAVKQKNFFLKIKQLFIRLWDKFKQAEALLTTVKEFIDDEENKKTFKLIVKQGKKVMRHLLPRKLRGQVTFGLEDPYTMGQVLTGAAMLYPIYGRQVTVQPVFDKQMLEGELSIKGRIRASVFLTAALRILLNKNFRVQLKKFRKQGGM